MSNDNKSYISAAARAKAVSVEGKTLYTLIVFSEHVAGILNQVTAVFTRRQVNIESINASPSSIEGVHKYTITCYSDEEEIKIITAQIERKVDVLKANYYTDNEIFMQETALLKMRTDKVLADPEISRTVRHHGAMFMDVNKTYMTVTKTGRTEDLLAMYYDLAVTGAVLQWVRSGRIAVTRSHTEYLDEFLLQREQAKKEGMRNEGKMPL
ncbi:MAG: acetolactate synthase small subunit [Bacteroidaceae bacterium]|nr:acetolactate synthase small subunit [Bacteroidaceae bacterium]